MLLTLNNVSYSYDLTREPVQYAVKDATLSIDEGEFIAVIGHTGSGKSTLIQFLDGLLKPTSGDVIFEGRNTKEKGFSMQTLRQNVGLVFQYPEHQLFETTVLQDVKFGPKNMGLSKEEQDVRAKEALALMGFGEEQYEKSPFDLSGGNKRKVAIAGVLAMKPKVLVLDEPTAGLDPESRTELLDLLTRLNKEENITIVLVSHSMDDVAAYAKRVIVMNHGSIVYDDETRAVFRHHKDLQEIGLSVPKVISIMEKLKARGLDVRTDVLNVEEAKNEIIRALNDK